MLSRETCTSTVSFTSCRSCVRGTAPRPSVATMELLESLNQAEERVMTAWTRIGLADVDIQSKWTGFVEGRLRPFLHDYVRLQLAEEMAIAAENDRLFREMLFASLRLKEPPRSMELAALVEAVVSQGTMKTSTNNNNNDNSNNDNNGTAAAENEEEKDKEDLERSFPCVWESEGMLAADDVPAEGLEGRGGIPSFVSVVTTLSARGGGDDVAVCSRSASFASRARDDGVHACSDHRSRSPSLPVADVYNSPHDAAWRALWQLARTMTHQELHRNLESEVERMNALADARLQQLCLLYKQRALLQLSPQEQSVLRRKYAEKLLTGEFDKHGRMAAQSSRACVHHAGVAASSNRESSSTHDGAYMTPGPSSGRATTCRSCQSVAKDDVDLLSDSLPEQLQVVNNECPQVLLSRSGKEESSFTAKTQEQSNTGRGTIFEVDLGDVMRFGRRQDLSLARINAEAREIYEEIIAQNVRMSVQADRELQCVEELWQLFEAGTEFRNVLDFTNEEQKDEGTAGMECVPSRQEFMYRLMQMRREYETPGGSGEGGAVAEWNTESETMNCRTDSIYNNINNNNNNNNNNTGGVGGGTMSIQLSTHSSNVHGFTSSPPTISDGSHTNTAATSTTTSVGGGGGNTHQLPPPLIKLFTTRSYAPILAYIVTVREELQRCLLRRHVRRAQTITSELTEMYRCYFEKTRDAAYYVAPDYSQWLQDNVDAVAEKQRGSCVNRSSNAEANSGIWQQLLDGFTPRSGNDALHERITEVRHVVSRASAEARLLSQRLRILNEVEPLLRRRAEIIEQQRDIQEGSRERLLSKKINMAKQLLFEENARRQFARELPKIYEKMEDLLRQWNDTMETEGENHNINTNNNNSTINVTTGNNNNNNSSSSGGGPTVRRLVLHGTDVADLVRQFRDDTTHGHAYAHAHLQSRKGRSPTPTPQTRTQHVRKEGTPAFPTPQRTPRAAPSLAHHNNNNNNNNDSSIKDQRRRYNMLPLSPVPRPVTTSVVSAQSTPLRNINNNNDNNKLRAAKKSANPASSVSPAPVKRTPMITRKRGSHSVPAVNEFLKRQPQKAPVRSNSSFSKAASVPPHVNAPTKK